MTKISNQYSLTNVLTADPVNGRVGIGTTSPNGLLQLSSLSSGTQGSINGASGTINRLIINCPYPGASAITLGYYSGSYGLDIWVNGDGTGLAPVYFDQRNNEAIIFRKNTYATATETMRITSTGNVGIGTSSPAVRLDVTGTDDVDSSIFFRVYSNNRTVWTGLGYRRIETNSELYIVANDSTIFRNSGSERMRITSGGTLLVGTTTSYSGKIVGFGDVVAVAGGGSNGLMSYETGNNTRYGFYNNGAGSLTVTNSGVANVGNFNMSSGAYTASSDINKKKDIEESTLGLNEILSLIPKTYRFKTESDEDKKHIGFIAQEVASIVPYAYSETKQPDELFIGLEYTAFIPVLVKAIQEQQLQINELKALLNA